MNLVIAGPFPSPIGGVSVHIKRLYKEMVKEFECVEIVDESPKKKADVFNIRTLNVLRYYKIIRNSDLVHIQSSLDVFRIVHLVFCLFLNKKCVVTFHSLRNKDSLLFKFQKVLLRKAETIICVNADIASVFTGYPIVRLHAFLPPNLQEQEPLPPELISWIAAKKAAGTKVAVSNAFRLDIFEGVDLYGLDMCLEMITRVADKYNLCLIFNVANLKESDGLFSKYTEYIYKNGISDKVLLTNYTNLSFVNLLQQSDFSIRATNTDGDALSIRESIFLNKPVVVSNVVTRPDGAFLFRSRDVDDMCSVISKLLGELDSLSSQPSQTNDYLAPYKRIYRI
ncbi:glycosyltransferase [Vibrio vulnificus]|nr:glycosyltransferase [Vibrio vulnificus]